MREHGKLRVSTLNLDHFDDDRQRRISAAAASVLRHRSDVVLLQEVTDVNGVDSARRLADELGMQVACHSPNGNAVLSSTPVISSLVVQLGDADAACIEIDTGCHRFVLASVHLSWGSGREQVRLREAMELDEWISGLAPHDPQRMQPEVYAVIGGDFNSEPDAATMRWLRGLDVHDDRSTLWVDSWLHGHGPGHTSTQENPYSARTAYATGFTQPDLIPDRRIDFLLARGFAHGRVGAPVQAELLGRGGTRSFGDHYGVGATFLC